MSDARAPRLCDGRRTTARPGAQLGALLAQGAETASRPSRHRSHKSPRRRASKRRRPRLPGCCSHEPPGASRAVASRDLAAPSGRHASEGEAALSWPQGRQSRSASDSPRAAAVVRFREAPTTAATPDGVGALLNVRACRGWIPLLSLGGARYGPRLSVGPHRCSRRARPARRRSAAVFVEPVTRLQYCGDVGNRPLA